MSVDECRLAFLVASLLVVYSFVFQQDFSHNASVFLLSCGTGLVAQIPLGRELNLYTPNITIYVSYVSVAVVVAWGAGLTSAYAAHVWLARVRGKSPDLGMFVLSGLPVLLTLEYTGSNIIGMKLQAYTRYRPLLPFLNAMRAPWWLYAYYVTVAFIFFCVLKGTGLYAPCARRIRCSPTRFVTSRESSEHTK